MKKKLCACLGLLLTLGVAVSASACGLLTTGTPDDSFPYDSAVQEGYTGSEAEWLEEKSQPATLYRLMWQEAVADGSFQGTYYEFLKSLNLSDDSLGLQKALLSTVTILSHKTGSESGTAGSGVIYALDSSKNDLTIITNYHVVYDSSSKKIYDAFDVCLYGGETSASALTAVYCGGAVDEDIAVLKVVGSDQCVSGSRTNGDIIGGSAARAADLADSDALCIGEEVFAVGSPEAWGMSAVKGVVSVDAETVEMPAIDNASRTVGMLEIRTDAPVNHGNSGGGLFNESGALVGIVNARSELSGVNGIGYAIPVNRAVGVMRNILDNNGQFRSAKLGITVYVSDSRSVYEETSGRALLSEKISIKEVESGSAAYDSGFDVGDTFLNVTFQGKKVAVTRSYTLQNLLLYVRKGDSITVEISRSGVFKTLTVTFDKDSYFVTK